MLRFCLSTCKVNDLRRACKVTSSTALPPLPNGCGTTAGAQRGKPSRCPDPDWFALACGRRRSSPSRLTELAASTCALRQRRRVGLSGDPRTWPTVARRHWLRRCWPWSVGRCGPTKAGKYPGGGEAKQLFVVLSQSWGFPLRGKEMVRMQGGAQHGPLKKGTAKKKRENNAKKDTDTQPQETKTQRNRKMCLHLPL